MSTTTLTGPDPHAVAEALHAAGETPKVSVPQVEPLGKGASRESWSITAGEHRYVLKRDPASEHTPSTSRLREFRMLTAAAAAGLPVARPVCAEPAGGRFGTAGLVTEFIDGTASPRALLGLDESSADGVVRQLGEFLGRLARIDPREVDGADPAPDIDLLLSARPDSVDSAVEILAGLEREVTELAADRPAFALALRWAQLHQPPPLPAVVVHGDFRLGNVIVGADGVAAVIDWEFAHYGDVAEDLAFFCLRPWRFGHDDRPAGGIGSRRALLDGYAHTRGQTVPIERLHYWEVVNQLRWGVYCLRQTDGYLRGTHRSLERLVVGRRVAEVEWDLLTLIEEGPRW